MSKAYVSTEKVPEEVKYLTTGKRYLAEFHAGFDGLGKFENDDGEITIITKDGCAHLDGGSWKIEPSEEPTA